MSKIEGWSKTGDLDHWTEWHNSYNSRRVIVHKFGMSRVWIVQIENVINQKEFSGKESATKFAVDYMRSHPRG